MIARVCVWLVYFLRCVITNYSLSFFVCVSLLKLSLLVQRNARAQNVKLLLLLLLLLLFLGNVFYYSLFQSLFSCSLSLSLSLSFVLSLFLFSFVF